MKPLLVYLDSSDYSFLSDSKKETSKTLEVKLKLKKWVDDGDIICCYSGIHLHEMAPVDAIHSEAAELRANLMVELCKRNSLISHEKIFQFELSQISKPSSVIFDPLSTNGAWYPDGIIELIKEVKVDMKATLDEVILESGLSRPQRRLIKRKTTKGLKAKKSFETSMIAEGRYGSLKEQLAKFPMREQDARVLSRYVSGDATAFEASEAFSESLRDPRWMMSWFKDHHDDLSPFIDRVRSPMLATIDSLKTLANLLESLNEKAAQEGRLQKQIEANKRMWEEKQDEMLINLAKRLSQQFTKQNAEQITLSAIDKNCPSLSVGVRSLCSAWSNTLLPMRPRPPANSDFPDSLHAMYAPYVDIFRADSFMTPIIKKHTQRFPVKVVGKLLDLPDAIESLLIQRSSAL